MSAIMRRTSSAGSAALTPAHPRQVPATNSSSSAHVASGPSYIGVWPLRGSNSTRAPGKGPALDERRARRPGRRRSSVLVGLVVEQPGRSSLDRVLPHPGGHRNGARLSTLRWIFQSEARTGVIFVLILRNDVCGVTVLLARTPSV